MVTQTKTKVAMKAKDTVFSRAFQDFAIKSNHKVLRSDKNTWEGLLRNQAEVTWGVALEVLVAKFDLWADDRIFDYESIPPLSAQHQILLKQRIETLHFAKANIARLAKEIIISASSKST